ncbi:MAG: hypothetical protein COT14_01520 [Candidatus Diapherotrites archaeon CG08_land_8_20_14_0_20_30_16]|nr:MAG: hypothetical protein COT14_01520 [Candidatus Diapherotrites archaeon CG08_land_8_20_14_0_20_30_16]
MEQKAREYFKQYLFMCGLNPETMLEPSNNFAMDLQERFSADSFQASIKSRSQASRVESKPQQRVNA